MKRRWRGPLNEFSSLQDEVSRLVDESLGRVGELWHGRSTELHIRADIYEDKDYYRLLLELPGIEQGDLDISLVGRKLTISGEKKKPEEDDEKGLRLGERVFGRLHRTFELEHDVDPDEVSAQLSQGVLHIRLTKRVEDTARKIEIKIG